MIRFSPATLFSPTTDAEVEMKCVTLVIFWLIKAFSEMVVKIMIALLAASEILKGAT